MTSYYIISKEIGKNESRAKISRLINFLEIQPTQKADIQRALISDFKDLEDAVQYYCASSISGLEGIITRNKKDFKSSQIPVLSLGRKFDENR